MQFGDFKHVSAIIFTRIRVLLYNNGAVMALCRTPEYR